MSAPSQEVSLIVLGAEAGPFLGDMDSSRSLGREDPPEKEMATHASILASRMLWTEEPGGLYRP